MIRQKSRRLTRARSGMGAVVGQDGDGRTAVNYYEALNKHPVGSNGLPRILVGCVRALSLR